jgi:tRNA(Ile)-lysidine synthase
LNIINKVITFITHHNLIPDKSTIIIGFSGGPDSRFLLHLLANLRAQKSLTLIAAHLDHEWRSSSANEAQFCQKIAHEYAIPCVTQKLSHLAPQLKFNGSREEYARKARRLFFSQLKKEYDAGLIALAHHAQDQQETFFIRLMRGATLTGLTAMHPKKDGYIRPLLTTNKTDIIAYLDQNNMAYVTDPSNSSLDFLRNRIRHTVLPALSQCDPRFETNIAATIERLQQTEQFLDTLSKNLFERCSTTRVVDGTPMHTLTLDPLLTQDPILIYRILMHWMIFHKVPFSPTQKFLDEIIRFLKQPGNKTHTIQSTWSIGKTGYYAFIQPCKSIK